MTAGPFRVGVWRRTGRPCEFIRMRSCASLLSCRRVRLCFRVLARIDHLPHSDRGMRDDQECIPLRELFSSYAFACKFDSGQVLLQEVEGNGKQDHIFHQKSDVSDHCGESARRCCPAIRHEGDDRDRRDEGSHRSEGPKTPSFLFQKPASNNAPNSHSEISRKYVEPLMPKTGCIQKMRDPWGKEWDETLHFIAKPFLIPEKEVDDHHRRADEVVVQVL